MFYENILKLWLKKYQNSLKSHHWDKTQRPQPTHIGKAPKGRILDRSKKNSEVDVMTNTKMQRAEGKGQGQWVSPWNTPPSPLNLWLSWSNEGPPYIWGQSPKLRRVVHELEATP